MIVNRDTTKASKHFHLISVTVGMRDDLFMWKLFFSDLDLELNTDTLEVLIKDVQYISKVWLESTGTIYNGNIFMA